MKKNRVSHFVIKGVVSVCVTGLFATGSSEATMWGLLGSHRPVDCVLTGKICVTNGLKENLLMKGSMKGIKQYKLPTGLGGFFGDADPNEKVCVPYEVIYREHVSPANIILKLSAGGDESNNDPERVSFNCSYALMPNESGSAMIVKAISRQKDGFSCLVNGKTSIQFKTSAPNTIPDVNLSSVVNKT